MSELRSRSLGIPGRLLDLQELRYFTLRIIPELLNHFYILKPLLHTFMNEGALFFLLTMQTTDMYIRLEGMKFYAYHGVLPQENLVGANYYIDLKLKTDFSRAAETDELEGTVNYADIHAVVKEEMQITSQLLEHVCQRIARRIFHDFPSIETIDISLFKENPPMGACAQRIGVEAHYIR